LRPFLRGLSGAAELTHLGISGSESAKDNWIIAAG
jgi:hypothetical protein